MSESNAYGRDRQYVFAVNGRSNSSFAQDRIRRRAAESSNAGRGGLAPNTPTLAMVAHPEFLLESLRAIKLTGGQGAGPDGVTYFELGRSDEGALCRGLADVLRDGTYRTSAAKLIHIKKVGGGLRILKLRSIGDRTVARAVKDVVEPIIDPHFLSTNYGFRPGRHVLQFLAALAVEIEGGRRVLAVDDVRKAFDNVVIERVLPLVARYVGDRQLLSLIETILRGGDLHIRHQVGVDQGCSLSPLILNLQLHYALDLVLRALTELPVVHRYADNLVSACTTEADAVRVIDRVRESLRQEGHTLKGEGGGIFHLEDGQEADLLGFQVQYADGRIRLRIPDRALNSLQERLRDVWELHNPIGAARNALRGWANFYGAGIHTENEERILDVIQRTTDNLGLQEALDPDLLRATRLQAIQRWNRELVAARGGKTGECA